MNQSPKIISYGVRLVMILAVLMLVFSQPGPAQAAPHLSDTVSQPADPEPYDDSTVYPDIQAPAGLVYYFDSIGGSDANTGVSPTQAWKTLTKFNSVVFPPGSTIYLKRGSVWTGAAIIKSNGTASARILYTAYGSGALPIFRNPGATNYYKVAIRITGDYNHLQYVKVIDSLLAGVYIDVGADYNYVSYIEATNVGEGVNVHGTYAKIIRNYIHDLVMVNNTPGGHDDYGAVGVWLFNHHNEVAYNRIINCRQPSFDFGEDGGAVELYKMGNFNYIHHNYVRNTKGFMEVGTGTTYYDNYIAYNVIVNSGRMLGLHFIGTPTSNIQRLRFENNTVIDTTAEGFAASILFMGDDPNHYSLIVRNNIFYLLNFKRISNVTNPDFTHMNNLYYIPNGSLGFPKAASEIVGNPLFVNLTAGNYQLQATSPAIDKGVRLSYTRDFLNRPVPVGPAPDMGAYEYQ